MRDGTWVCAGTTKTFKDIIKGQLDWSWGECRCSWLSSWPQTQRVSLQQVTSSWSGKQASTAAPISAEGSTVKFSEEDSKDLGHQIVRVSHS